MPDRYAPAGPLALALEALAEERYADALDRVEQALALSPGEGSRDARPCGSRWTDRPTCRPARR